MSGDGTFVATASMQLNRKITAWRVLPDGIVDANVSVEAKFEHPVSEILFDSESEHLVVVCQEVIRVWTLETGILHFPGLNNT